MHKKITAQYQSLIDVVVALETLGALDAAARVERAASDLMTQTKRVKVRSHYRTLLRRAA